MGPGPPDGQTGGNCSLGRISHRLGPYHLLASLPLATSGHSPDRETYGKRAYRQLRQAYRTRCEAQSGTRRSRIHRVDRGRDSRGRWRPALLGRETPRAARLFPEGQSCAGDSAAGRHAMAGPGWNVAAADSPARPSVCCRARCYSSLPPRRRRGFAKGAGGAEKPPKRALV